MGRKVLQRYAFIPSPVWAPGLEYLHNQEWSILENNYDNFKPDYQPKPDLLPLAFSLAMNEIQNLHYAPRLSIGKPVAQTHDLTYADWYIPGREGSTSNWKGHFCFGRWYDLYHKTFYRQNGK